jgi:DNA polymerase (family 10)
VDNPALARVFGEIADLLEIKGENPFKIRAYRNASEAIAHSAARIADLTPAERLAIQGIGKDLSAKIGELIESGSIAYHRELLEEFPPTILDMLHLQGVGPRTAALLFRELNIRTLDELEAAAREGRLRPLKGMGRKKEEQILRSLEERARFTGRRLLAEAHDTAAELVAALREHAPDAEIAPVGSLRRGCETCGDLDILAAGAPPSLMDAFTGYRLVERVVAHACGAASRRTSASCRARASARPSSISPDRKRTTSRCAIAPSSGASN